MGKITTDKKCEFSLQCMIFRVDFNTIFPLIANEVLAYLGSRNSIKYSMYSTFWALKSDLSRKDV